MKPLNKPSIALRRLIYLLLGKISFVFNNKPKIVILCYHSVNKDGWRFSIDPEVFKKQMEYLVGKYDFWNLEDLNAYFNGQLTLNNNKVIITFDDGYKDIMTTRKLLSDLKAKPTVFVITDSENVNRKELDTDRELLSVADLKTLINDGWTIGSHTSTHSALVNLTKNQLTNEIAGSKESLKKELQTDIDFIAYPKGVYNKEVVNIVEKSGYKLGLSMDDSIINKKTNRLAVPRIGVDRTHSFAEFKQMTKTLPIYFRKIVKSLNSKPFIHGASGFHKIMRDIKLFWQTPIEYLWSYTYSSKKKIKIEPFNPSVKKTGDDIVSTLAKEIPDLEVYFIGSAALKLPGQKDIDLIATSDPKDFKKYLPNLIKLFGKPDKMRRKFCEWHFIKNGCEVELLLCDPESRVCKDPLKGFNLLNNNKEILNRYRKIKLESNGLSIREYKRVRLEFFNRIIQENPAMTEKNSLLRKKSLDFWLFLATTIISITALCFFYFSGQKNLVDYDAIARLNIARKVFDSLTPGLAQLGGIWLPFPQVLFMPFIWSNFLWHTGLAGAFGSMAAFILGAVFLYKTVFLVTGNKIGGVLAWLIYITNINILFLQSMAMSESFFLFTMIMIIYYLTRWAKSRRLLDLLYTSFFLVLTTLTRYEGYALYGAAALTVAVVIFVIYGKSNLKRLEGTLILFMTLAGFGIFLWSLYSWLIFKDPIYWLNLYAGNKQLLALDPTQVSQVLKNITVVAKKISILDSFKIYGSSMLLINGVLVSTLSIFAFLYLFILWIIHIIRKEINVTLLPTMIVTLCVFLFLIVGYSKRLIPNMETPIVSLSTIMNQSNNFASSSNIRYGIIILPLIALIIGIAYSKAKYLSVVLLTILSIQIYSLFRPPLFLTFSLSRKETYKQLGVSVYFIDNYDGGLILTSANRHENFIFQTGFPYKDFIYEGNQQIWKDSLTDPSKYAKWVVLDTVDTGDAVNTLMTDKTILNTRFNMVYKEGNVEAFKLK